MKKILNLIVIITIIFTCTACLNKENISKDKKMQISFNNLTLELPETFEEGNFNNTRDDFKSYTMVQDSAICSLYLTYQESSEEKDSDKEKIKKWLEVTKEVNKSNSEINYKDINSTNWGYLKIEEDNTIDYYYSTINSKQLYTIQYTYYTDSDKVCESLGNDIMNSIEFIK